MDQFDQISPVDAKVMVSNNCPFFGILIIMIIFVAECVTTATAVLNNFSFYPIV